LLEVVSAGNGESYSVPVAYVLALTSMMALIPRAHPCLDSWYPAHMVPDH